jgi:hypothetical protein
MKVTKTYIEKVIMKTVTSDEKKVKDKVKVEF